jgi:hypothetical protein
MGKRLLVALTMGGEFVCEGLQSIDEDDDMLSAMARELVERNGIGDSADSGGPSVSNINGRFRGVLTVTMMASIEMPSALFLSLANSGLRIHFSSTSKTLEPSPSTMTRSKLVLASLGSSYGPNADIAFGTSSGCGLH